MAAGSGGGLLLEGGNELLLLGAEWRVVSSSISHSSFTRVRLEMMSSLRSMASGMASEFWGVVGVTVGVGEEVGLGEVGGGELVTRVDQYWRVELRFSRMCWASGYTRSDQVSNRG